MHGIALPPPINPVLTSTAPGELHANPKTLFFSLYESTTFPIDSIKISILSPSVFMLPFSKISPLSVIKACFILVPPISITTYFFIEKSSPLYIIYNPMLVNIKITFFIKVMGCIKI